MLKFNIRASFTNRLIAGCLVALFLLSIPVVILVYLVLRDNTINQAGLTAVAQTEHIAQSVNRHLQGHLRDLIYTSQLGLTFGELNQPGQNRLLQIMRENTPGYLWIGVASTDGTVLAALDNLLVGKSVAARPWFKQGLVEPAIMDVHEAALLATLLPSRAEEKYRFIDFTTPLKSQNGEVIGVIGVHLDWKYFISEIEQDVFNTINPSSPTVILARDGSLRMGNRLEQADLQEGTLWTDMSGFQSAVEGRSTWSVETLRDGKDYLIAFAPNQGKEIDGLGWVSATLTPLDAVAPPVSTALMGNILALIIGTASTLLLVLALGRSLSNQARAYLDQVRRNDPDALARSLDELPTELQPISRDILELTRGLTKKSLSLENALKSAKESYWVVEALIVQAPVPIAMFDNDMNYVAASSRWAQIFTHQPGSLVGQNFYTAAPSLPPHWRQAHRAGLAGESISATSDPWTNPQGEVIWLDWAIEPWLRPDGQRGGIIMMCKDVTEERQVRNSLAESEERFKLAMEGSHDGLWDWDIRANTVYFSPSWKRLLGYEDHELLNCFSTWEQLTASDDLESTKSRLTTALQDPSKRSYEAEFRMRHKNGRWIDILSKALIVRDDDGEPTRVVGTHQDRTVQLALESQLRETAIAAKAEKDANAEKSRFLATMSHEIRTPLNGILGFSRLLQMDLPPGELKDQAAYLVQSAETLSTILNDILDFSKLESGMVRLVESPFLMDQLLRSSSELSRLACETKGIEFELTNLAGDQQIYLGDMGRLRQIIQNLLSNAIKFTSQGKVSLKAWGTAVDEERDLLSFEVCDTGRGIPIDQQIHLFKPFSQVHEDSESRFGGTGLGLSIVKSLIGAMQGDVRLESESGKGTRVTFSVTLKRGATLHIHSEERIAPARSLHLLVADDTPLNVKLLQVFLRKDGHTVDVAQDGQQALAKAQSQRFDFILLDIDMPKLSGYEVAREIRRLPGPNQHCEMATLTGYAFDSDIEEAEAAGFNHHFSKPIQFHLLLNRLAISSRNAK